MPGVGLDALPCGQSDAHLQWEQQTLLQGCVNDQPLLLCMLGRAHYQSSAPSMWLTQARQQGI